MNLWDMANKYEEYVIGVIENRNPKCYYSLLCSAETYEEAKEHEKVFHADGIMNYDNRATI